MVRVLIVDDHPVFRDGMATLVDRMPSYTVVAQAESQVTAMRAMRQHTIELVIVDLTLSSGGGLSLVRGIRAEWPEMAILMVSMHDERTHAERAFRAGANGYIMKHQPWDELNAAIRRVVAGQYSYSNTVMRTLMQQQTGNRGTASLSDRELEVFDLLGRGLRIREVAPRLNISPKTVESHVAAIKRKLGIRHSNELVHRATVHRTMQTGISSEPT